MFLTSLAVLVFFHRSRAEITDTASWHTRVAPVLAIVGLGAALYLSFTNFTLVTGGDRGIAIALQAVTWAVFAAGIRPGAGIPDQAPGELCQDRAADTGVRHETSTRTGQAGRGGHGKPEGVDQPNRHVRQRAEDPAAHALRARARRDSARTSHRVLEEI